MFNITRLRILNYMGLEHVCIEKAGKIVRIKGENGVGKSAILAAIRGMFESAGVDLDNIMVDKERAEVHITLEGLGQVIEAKRVMTATTNKPTVKVDGKLRTKTPATFLAALVGKLNMNPIDFFLGDEHAQRQMLLEAMPCVLTPDEIQTELDTRDITMSLTDVDFDQHAFTVLAALQTLVFDWRRGVKQEVDQLAKSIAQDKQDLPEGVDDGKWKEFDLSIATEQLTLAQKDQSEHDARARQRDELRTAWRKLNDEEERLVDQLKKVRQAKADNNEQGLALTAQINAFVSPDLAALQQQIGDYNEHVKHAATLEGIARKQTEHDTADARHGQLDEFHKWLRVDMPKLLLARLDVPVPGLVITPDRIMVDNKPLRKLSKGEQIVFAGRLAKSLAGNAGFLCIDGYEQLQGRLRTAFEKEMADDDFSYWITETTPDSLLLVDGASPAVVE